MAKTLSPAVGEGPPSVVAADRIAGFDLLRGICAISVAAYHVLSWHDFAHFHTWGTYGVYIFFVLSGASMYVAYAERFERGYAVGRFIALRFIRLAPLYFLGLALALAYKGYKGELGVHHLAQALLNVGFVFGLGNPGTTSEVAGGWSIGIEFAFYLVFPVVLAMVASRRWAWFVVLAFVAQQVFVNAVLAGGTLPDRWGAYTQPLAFAFYFVAGCAIGRAVRFERLPSGVLGAGVFVGSVVAIGVASGATSEYTLTGLLGVGLSLLAALAVASSATLNFGPAGHRISEVLGRASYGVYILHPWVWAVLAFAGRRVGAGPVELAVLTAAASVPLALLVERFIEKPVQRWMKARLAR